MAAVVVVGKSVREDQKVEVTLSKDGIRFTVVVPQSVAEAPEAHALYEVMAARVCARQAVVTGIVDLIRRT